jgi:hypothetical protein
MGFSIHYRSTEAMHPARAYEIKQHAQRLIDGYTWVSCEPVIVHQQSDGYLAGQSKPNFFPAEIEAHAADMEGIPDGTVLALAEVLCLLSRDHGVDWDIAHDYEPDPIGRICDGVADVDLIEQLETLGSLGDLLDEMLEDDDAEWESSGFGVVDDPSSDDDHQEEEPRVLKFPGTE